MFAQAVLSRQRMNNYNLIPKSLDQVPASCKEIARILNAHKIPFFLEWEFDRQDGGSRRWRHDIFIPCRSMGSKRGIAVEVEGGMMGGRSWSRHNTVSGFEADLEKYSASMAKGNYVYRTSTKIAVIRQVMQFVVEHYQSMEGIQASAL